MIGTVQLYRYCLFLALDSLLMSFVLRARGRRGRGDVLGSEVVLVMDLMMFELWGQLFRRFRWVLRYYGGSEKFVVELVEKGLGCSKRRRRGWSTGMGFGVWVVFSLTPVKSLSNTNLLGRMNCMTRGSNKAEEYVFETILSKQTKNKT